MVIIAPLTPSYRYIRMALNTDLGLHIQVHSKPKLGSIRHHQSFQFFGSQRSSWHPSSEHHHR